MNLDSLTTEKRNPATMNLDEISLYEAAILMNKEDQQVALAVEKEIPSIEKAVEIIVSSLKKDGRLIYMGAGTSGRLGVLDAAECIPTFSTTQEQVQGFIAGGEKAMKIAVEGAEDSEELAIYDLQSINLNSNDTVVGIAASGRTPYVIGALDYAKLVGASTISLSCNKGSEIGKHAEIAIEVEVGPEFLTGSTRLKSGTAQKLVLNMLSTLSMIGIGKVYNNLMVDVKPTNEKLIERSKRIIMQATDCTYEVAEKAFEESKRNVRLAIVYVLSEKPLDKVKEALSEAEGNVKATVLMLKENISFQEAKSKLIK